MIDLLSLKDRIHYYSLNEPHLEREKRKKEEKGKCSGAFSLVRVFVKVFFFIKYKLIASSYQVPIS